MRHVRKRPWHLITIVLGVVLVTACTSEPATPTPRLLDKVSLQLQWVTQAQFAGYYVALDKGWYQEEGIDLTINPGGPDLVPVDLVSSGRHDFGTSLMADLVVAVQRGSPVVSIAQIQQENGLVLIAKKSSGIAEPKDFVGKSVGVWLGGWEAQFDALVAKEGIAAEDFELVSQGWSMDPFLEGGLDVASAMIYNEYHVVLESGVKPEDLNIIDYADYGLDFPGDLLFTHRQTAEQNPDLCTRMVRASLRGWQYAVEHPEEAADIVLKYDESGVQTRKHQLSMMDEIARLVQVSGHQLGHTDQTSLERVINTLLKFKVLDGPVQSKDVYTNRFWEQARAEAQ